MYFTIHGCCNCIPHEWKTINNAGYTYVAKAMRCAAAYLTSVALILQEILQGIMPWDKVLKSRVEMHIQAQLLHIIRHQNEAKVFADPTSRNADELLLDKRVIKRTFTFRISQRF